MSSLRSCISSSHHRTSHRPCCHCTSHHRREATPSTPVTIGSVADEKQTPLSRFSSLLLLPACETTSMTIAADAAGSVCDHCLERRSRSVYDRRSVCDHRRERRCRRCSTIPFREKERCATTLRLVTTVSATVIGSATITRPHSTVQTSNLPATIFSLLCFCFD